MEALELEDEATPHRGLEIRGSDGCVIIVIEVLSPTNKGRAREEYLAKRVALRNAGVNLVEIDLLRGGSAPPGFARLSGRTEGQCPSLPYVMAVYRAARPGFMEYYRRALRDPLPVIRILLRPDDLDVPLDVRALVNRVYEMGRYWLQDFREPLTPPLSEEDAEWALQCLTDAGLT